MPNDALEIDPIFSNDPICVFVTKGHLLLCITMQPRQYEIKNLVKQGLFSLYSLVLPLHLKMQIKRGRESDDETSFLDGVLGRGTYNAVFKVRGANEVLRVAAVRDIESAKDLERGGLILNLFTRAQDEMGPSVLRETRPGRHVSSWDDPTFINEVMERYPAARYYIQQLEFLSGGTIGQSKQPTEAGTFSLVWFIWVAQAKFGFSHRDLSRGNIMFRILEEPQAFVFEVAPNERYRISMTQVPVVIDFDFGSVAITNAARRRSLTGTLEYCPPTLLAEKMRQMNDYFQHQSIGDEYDWWSLGVILIDWWTQGKLNVPGGLAKLLVPKQHVPDWYVRCGEALLMALIYEFFLTARVPNMPEDLVRASAVERFLQRNSENIQDARDAMPPNILGLLRRIMLDCSVSSPGWLFGEYFNQFRVADASVTNFRFPKDNQTFDRKYRKEKRGIIKDLKNLPDSWKLEKKCW